VVPWRWSNAWVLCNSIDRNRGVYKASDIGCNRGVYKASNIGMFISDCITSIHALTEASLELVMRAVTDATIQPVMLMGT
jgi:hypothetical protein